MVPLEKRKGFSVAFINRSTEGGISIEQSVIPVLVNLAEPPTLSQGEMTPLISMANHGWPARYGLTHIAADGYRTVQVCWISSLPYCGDTSHNERQTIAYWRREDKQTRPRCGQSCTSQRCVRDSTRLAKRNPWAFEGTREHRSLERASTCV